MIYYFKRPNQMIPPGFTDDVAIVKALSKKQAVKLFNLMYSDVKEKEVFRLTHNELSYTRKMPFSLTCY